MSDEVVNKIMEKQEEEEDDEDDVVDTQVDNFRDAIKTVTMEVASYTMIDHVKRKKFADELKKNKVCNEYVVSQLYLKFLKTDNPHIKVGICYAYLYIKTLNGL